MSASVEGILQQHLRGMIRQIFLSIRMTITTTWYGMVSQMFVGAVCPRQRDHGVDLGFD